MPDTKVSKKRKEPKSFGNKYNAPEYKAPVKI